MRHGLTLFALLMAACGSPLAMAHEEPPAEAYAQHRFEFWLGVSHMPGLDDLEPLDGDFDSTGFGLGGAWHVPVKRFENSDLLLGIDGYLGVTGSSLSGYIGDVSLYHVYLGGSAKWAFGERRNIYLDAGVGYHGVDISELDDDYLYGDEHEAWSDSAGGAFVGASWDIGAQRAHETAGLTLGFKVHFVDFGRVYDEDTYIGPILGDDAGDLDGPIYILQIGYGGR